MVRAGNDHTARDAVHRLLFGVLWPRDILEHMVEQYERRRALQTGRTGHGARRRDPERDEQLGLRSTAGAD